MGILILILALNLIPTEHDQSIMYMYNVRGWKPYAGDMKRMDYLGLKYEKDKKPVDNVIAVK